jgi:hypothetical protein
MSLAFALTAAINSSTGSWATLSHGLSLPHHASPASTRRTKDSHPSDVAAQPPGTLSQDSAALACVVRARENPLCGSVGGVRSRSCGMFCLLYS